MYECKNNIELYDLFYQLDRLNLVFKKKFSERKVYGLIVLSNKKDIKSNKADIDNLIKITKIFNYNLIILNVNEEYLGYQVKEVELDKKSLIIHNEIKTIQEKLTNIEIVSEKRISANFDEKITAIQTNINTQFSDINTKFSDINTKFSDFNRNFSDIYTKFSDINTKFSAQFS